MDARSTRNYELVIIEFFRQPRAKRYALRVTGSYVSDSATTDEFSRHCYHSVTRDKSIARKYQPGNTRTGESIYQNPRDIEIHFDAERRVSRINSENIFRAGAFGEA